HILDTEQHAACSKSDAIAPAEPGAVAPVLQYVQGPPGLVPFVEPAVHDGIYTHLSPGSRQAFLQLQQAADQMRGQAIYIERKGENQCITIAYTLGILGSQLWPAQRKGCCDMALLLQKGLEILQDTAGGAAVPLGASIDQSDLHGSRPSISSGIWKNSTPAASHHRLMVLASTRPRAVCFSCSVVSP